MKILVSSIKQRDVDHFEMVYNYYMPVLYRFAMQYAYDSETAKDLVHDAFAWVWNNPDKIRDDGNVAALLYRLVRSNCLNYLRSLDIRDCNDRKYAEAAAFAEFLFDDEDALIRVDMSEFSEKYAASRLFGAPPGYVGYEEGGELTEKVRRKPFSVVLFDEIEKAHPDIFNTLLQVLDDGHLTDGQGRKVDFKNTIIILTTNLGTRDIAKAANTGFNLGANNESSYQRMKDQVSSELKQQFRPEFLNRLDDIIVFKQLTEPQVRQIVDLDVKQLNDRLFDRHMSLELTDAAKDLLAQKGFDPLLGARPLRRVIQRDVEDAISEKILMGELEDGQRVKVDAEGEGILGEFTFTGEAFEEPNTEPAEGEVAAETEAPAESTESTELTESAESVE